MTKTLAIQAQEELDARGLNCPEPLMLVRNKIRKMKSGEILHICATDPTTERDLNQFCTFLGHELLRQARVDDEFHYLLRKQAAD